nr:hypothetical protein [Tanacetum cinerariifolium]
MKRVGKGFSGKETSLFLTMIVRAQEDMGEGSTHTTDPHHTPTINQPSTSKPQKKQKPRKPRRQDTKETQPSGPTTNVEDEAFNEENISTQSNDPPLLRVNTLRSGEDRLKLKELMKFYKEITLVDETTKDRGRFDDQDMFDTEVLDDDEVVVKKAITLEEVNATSIITFVSAAATTTAATTPTISMDEITLAKALIEKKTSRPKAKGIVMQDLSETPTPTPIVSSQQPSKHLSVVLAL